LLILPRGVSYFLWDLDPRYVDIGWPNPESSRAAGLGRLINLKLTSSSAIDGSSPGTHVSSCRTAALDKLVTRLAEGRKGER
jgi:hypothetical protein